MVLLEKRKIYAGTIIHTVCCSNAFQFQKVDIALLVFCEQNDMAGMTIFGRLIGNILCCVQLHTENWLNAILGASIVKRYYTIHVSMVSDGKCRLTHFFSLVDEFVDSAVSIQNTITGMDVQMGEHKEKLLSQMTNLDICNYYTIYIKNPPPENKI